jgi:SAM-dependent methyltransferase
MTFAAAADAYELLCDAARLERELPHLRTWLDRDDGRALDLACGLGDHLGALLAAGAIASGTGLDLAPEMVARARERHPDARLRFVEGDLTLAAIGDHDRVLCLGNALACLPDMPTLLHTLTRLVAGLPPDGRLLVQVSNPQRPGADHSSVVRHHDGLTVVKTVVRRPDASLLSLTVHRRTETGWTSATSHQVLLLPNPRDLAEAVHAARPAELRLTGQLDGSPFDPATSPDIVLSVRR